MGIIVIKDGIGRPLYNILSDGTRIDLLGNPITKQQSSEIKYSDYQTESKFSWYSFWIGFCFASLVWGILNYFINYYNGIRY